MPQTTKKKTSKKRTSKKKTRRRKSRKRLSPQERLAKMQKKGQGPYNLDDAMATGLRNRSSAEQWYRRAIKDGLMTRVNGHEYMAAEAGDSPETPTESSTSKKKVPASQFSPRRGRVSDEERIVLLESAINSLEAELVIDRASVRGKESDLAEKREELARLQRKLEVRSLAKSFEELDDEGKADFISALPKKVRDALRS